jgi:hypothetical protein
VRDGTRKGSGKEQKNIDTAEEEGEDDEADMRRSSAHTHLTAAVTPVDDSKTENRSCDR